VTTLIVILVIGGISGFINTIAGGGSLITLPILIFLGLPAATANGTNRVALVVQSGVAVWNFKRKGYYEWRLGLLFGVPAMIGAAIGAQLAINTPDAAFNKILAVIMLLILWLTIKPPKKKTESGENDQLSKAQLIIGMAGFLFIGLYGGFIQAGVGFIVMAFTNTLIGMSLVRINSIKVFVTGLYLTVSLITFILSGNVHWTYGIVLAVGNGIGAWLGSSFAVSKGDKWIKRFLVVTVLFLSLKLLLGF